MPQQRQLANELARTRTKRASLEHELREIDGELNDLAPQRERHHLVVDACASLEKLAAVGGDQLFWGSDTSAQRAAEHLQAARSRVAELGQWFSHMEGRQAALRQQIQHCNDTIDAIERALFEVQYEEEQLSYEWEIEREIDEKPRKAILSWAYDGEDDKRFRKSAAIALLLTLLLSAVISQITLPPLIVNGQEMPERVVRLLMEERPKPPPAAVEMPKPKVHERSRSSRPCKSRRPSPRSSSSRRRSPRRRIRASSRSARDSPRATTIRSSAASVEARIDNSDYGGGARSARC